MQNKFGSQTTLLWILDFTRSREFGIICNIISPLARGNLPFLSSRHKSCYLFAIPFGRLRLSRPHPPPLFYSPHRVTLPFRPLVFHPLHVSRAPSTSFTPCLASFQTRVRRHGGSRVAKIKISTWVTTIRHVWP